MRNEFVRSFYEMKSPDRDRIAGKLFDVFSEIYGKKRAWKILNVEFGISRRHLPVLRSQDSTDILEQKQKVHLCSVVVSINLEGKKH